MTKTYLKSMAIAALACGTMIAAQPASAIVIRNCTDIVIKVQVFNNNDALRVIALRQANIGTGDAANMEVGGNKVQIKVFKAQLFDAPILVKGGMGGYATWTVRGKGGSYSVSSQNDCQTASTGGGGGGGPVVTIPVDSGKWVGAGKPLTIRTASSTSFTLKRKGKKGRTTYSLVGRDTYRGGDGNTFVMLAQGQANWGGTRIRLK